MKFKSILFALAVTGTTQFSGTAAETNAVSKKEPLPHFPPKGTNEVAGTFTVQDGFKMELIAAEPLVTDPVAMVYDENGLAYVVEMNDYPYTDKHTHEAWKENKTDKAIGKIRVMEDTDGDGKFDKSYIFAEGLSWASGILCWKGGVFVTATPDIWYLKDTDGDHKADIRKKVFTGFRKYNVQAVMNNPIWGLDNKIYVAGSGNGGSVVPGDKPNEKPITFTRSDFSIDPVTEKFEAISGGARFGNTFDNWGNRFICNIRNPAQQIVLQNRYFARNPFLAVPSAIYDSAEAGDTLPVFRTSPVEPWRELRAKLLAADTEKKTPRSELTGGGVFTSASGITVYRGSAYPEKYQGNAFVGEVANNVIYRQTLTSEGVTFKAQRADDKVEFVASTDTWFRPVNFVNAPDGTLHVLDMYRETIEHPWSIPDDIREQLDLENGRDRGRIYRLEPPGFKASQPPRLGKATVAELVAQLENQNAWWRETAQRLLFERQDQSAVEPLRALLTKSKNPLARLHALYTLDGLNALRDEDILTAMGDAAAGVREHAVCLSEPRLEKSPALVTRLALLFADPDIRVRFQTVLSAGGIVSPQIADSIYSVAKRDRENPWIRAAVGAAHPDNTMRIVVGLLRDEDFVTDKKSGLPLLRQEMFTLGAHYKLGDIYEVLNRYYLVQYCHCFVQEAFWGGLGDGVKQHGKTLRSAFPNPASFGAQKVDYLFGYMQSIAQNETDLLNKRQEAIKLLAYDDFDRVKDFLTKLLDTKQPQEVQVAAVRVLSTFKDASVAKILLQGWRSYTPPVREEVVNALFARKERIQSLMGALADGTIAPSQLTSARKTSLLANTDTKIRDQAQKVFGQGAAASRKDVLEKYKTALSLVGDKERGVKVYENNCMTCHRAGGKGNDIGPNLESVRQWDPEKVLMNILDPNREVAPTFVSYEVELKDGTSLSGVIADETANSITLKRAENASETILRSNIAKISSGGMSLMPEGLESAIPPQDMADLIAFLLAK